MCHNYWHPRTKNNRGMFVLLFLFYNYNLFRVFKHILFCTFIFKDKWEKKRGVNNVVIFSLKAQLEVCSDKTCACIINYIHVHLQYIRTVYLNSTLTVFKYKGTSTPWGNYSYSAMKKYLPSSDFLSFYIFVTLNGFISKIPHTRCNICRGTEENTKCSYLLLKENACATPISPVY